MSDELGYSRTKLPLRATAIEALAALHPVLWILIIQIMAILAVEVALEVAPALLFGMASNLVFGLHVRPTPLLVSLIVSIVKILFVVLLYLNLMFCAARAVLLAERPTVVSLFQWRGRQWQGMALLFVFLLLVQQARAVAIAMPSLSAPVSDWADFLISGSRTSLVGILILLWMAGWLITVIPAVAIRADFIQAWKMSEGNRLRLMAFPAAIIVGVFTPCSVLAWLSTFRTDVQLIGVVDGFLIDRLAIALTCVAYAAIGAAVYRRLATTPSRSANALTPADSRDPSAV